jgi:uroporphyrin-3 C-methyltransferase
METNEQPPPAAEQSAPPPPEPKSKSAGGVLLWRVVASLLILAALGASGWVWYDSRGRLGATQEELARRLRAIEDDARNARAAASAAQDAARDVQAKAGALEARVDDAQSQQAALESLYQELSRNRDEWQLAEIEQVLAIAQQQLQLAGNVRSALLALQLAEQRLARADRPQFQPVRRALARDIERLKALPAVDLAALSRRLDEVIDGIDDLPLAFDARLQPAAPAAPPEPGAAGALARFGAALWRDLKELVVVRRVDAPEPPLLPPGQAYFLRENLRLRLLSARLALLGRNPAVYKSDLAAAAGWLERYFDAQSAPVREALAQLRALQQSQIRFEPPSITDSLDAVRGFKARRERAPG